MFFTSKKNLERRVADLEANLFRVKMDLDTNTIRLNALMRVYPYGANKDGSPRKKIGRPHKKVEA